MRSEPGIFVTDSYAETQRNKAPSEEQRPIITDTDHLSTLLMLTMRTCKHESYLLIGLFYALLKVVHYANGFVGSRSCNIKKLMATARTMRLVSTNIPSSILESPSCLHERRSYDDNSDEALFAALLDDKSKASASTASSPISSSLDTSSLSSEYAHLANVTSPCPSLKPEEIIPLIMNALKNNDVPEKDAGLRLVWEFATETTQYVFQNNRTGE